MNWINKIIRLFILMGLSQTNYAQSVDVLQEGKPVSLRGLSVVTDRVAWASGSKGTVAKTVDSGKTWQWMTVQGFEQIDFRDIEAFSETEALIMGVAAPAYILRTVDGGNSWQVVYENRDTTMFLDAMEFWNEQSGIVLGDPQQGKFYIARTFTGGRQWQTIPEQNYPVAEPGEACFASSGTNIRRWGKKGAAFVTGGKRSRLFINDRQIDLPILQGKESTGANSLAIKKQKHIIVVGGDFTQRNDTTGNCIISPNAGKSWIRPAKPPTGYRSCVEYIRKSTWITCGLNGVDISTDDGQRWTNISPTGFHVCRKAKDGKQVYLAGSNGRIGKLKL